MDINEIANDIMKKEDNQLAKAFTMTIGKMLISNGIQPIIIKSPEHWVTDDDINSYIIRKEYNATFDIDTTEHDKQIRAELIDEIKIEYKRMFNCGYTDCVTCNVCCNARKFMDKLEQLKEKSE